MSNTYEVTLTKKNDLDYGIKFYTLNKSPGPGIFIQSNNSGISNINIGDKVVAVKIDNAKEGLNKGWQPVNTGNSDNDFTILTVAINNASISNSPMSFRLERIPGSSSSLSSTIKTSVPTDKNIYTVTLKRKNDGEFGIVAMQKDNKLTVISVSTPIITKGNKIEVDDEIISLDGKNVETSTPEQFNNLLYNNSSKEYATLVLRHPVASGSIASGSIVDKNIYTAILLPKETIHNYVLGITPGEVNNKLIVESLDNVNYSPGSSKINIGDQILKVNNEDLTTLDIKEQRRIFFNEISKKPDKLNLELLRLNAKPTSSESIETDVPSEKSASASSSTSIPSTSTASSIPSATSKITPLSLTSSSSIVGQRQSDSDDESESEVSSPITTKTGTKLTETIVPLPPNLSPSVSSSPSVGAKYLTNDNTLVNNRNVGTILLNNGTTYYGPMDATVDTSNPPYELLHISSLYGKIRDTKGTDLKPDWSDILYDPSNPTNIPKSDWEWTNNYLIKQQYAVDDTSITLNDEISIVIFMNDYIYNGPLGMISIDKTVPHYEITLLHVSSKYGQIADMNGDVIIKPTDVPLLSGLAPPSSNVGTGPKWSDVLFDNNNITTATESIKKLTGIWEWTEYFNNYFSVPGLVMPDPNTQLSELMETELTKRVDMDNIVFKTDNLEMMKPILEHEIIVVGQAIILTLKYIYENNISAYTISDPSKQKCNINLDPGSKSGTETETGTNIESGTGSGIVQEVSTAPSYDSAYSLYQQGKLSDCLDEINKITEVMPRTPLFNKIYLLKILCQLEQKPVITQSDGNAILDAVASGDFDLSDNETLQLLSNVYYYLYSGIMNNELAEEANDNSYKNEKTMNNLKTLQLNTFSNIFTKIGLDTLADKYETAYIGKLTVQDKENYDKQINDTLDAAKAAEQNSQWTIANILFNRAHRYAVVYFGMKNQLTKSIDEQKSDYEKRQAVATDDLTKTIASLYKQLSMDKPQSAFTTFYARNQNTINPNTLTNESKTAIKAILASVSQDEKGLDFFKNMKNDIKIEQTNIYDLLLILIKNIILLLNLYLIVEGKIYREQPGSNSGNNIVNYFQDLNLYYGFKQSYEKIIDAMTSARSSGNIEQNPDAIIQNNSQFTNMLLLGLASTLGLSGITIGAAIGGRKKYSRKRSNKKKMVTKRRYNSKKRNRNYKISRKYRKKNSKYTR